MRFSYLEHVEREILPTIEILWEISRTFHGDSDAYVGEYYQLIRELAEHHRGQSEHEKLTAICRAFYRELGFSEAPESHLSAKRILLDRVISYRTGLPIAMAVLLQEALAYAGLQAELVDFPGYPLLRCDDDQHSYFIDPCNGRLLENEQVRERFSELTDDGHDFAWELLVGAEQKTILVRYLTDLKHAFIQDRAFANALTTVHMLLTLLPNDPYEIRDRGYVLEELDCPQAAVDDYQYFVEQCPDDPSAQLLRLQLETWAAPQPILH